MFASNFTWDDYLNCPNNEVKFFLKTKREKRHRERMPSRSKKNVILIFFSTGLFVLVWISLGFEHFWPIEKTNSFCRLEIIILCHYNEIQSIEIYWMHILCGFFKPNTVASTLRVTYKFPRASEAQRESECNMLSEMLRVAYHETSAAQTE